MTPNNSLQRTTKSRLTQVLGVSNVHRVLIGTLLSLSTLACKTEIPSEPPERRRIQEILVGDGGVFDERSDLPMEELFDNPAIFEGRRVWILGLVDDQDPLKHWLYLDSGDGRIYVETPMLIEQLVGEYVQITGNVVLKQGSPFIVAIGIERR